MPFENLLREGVFDPEDVARMATAYEIALTQLRLSDRDPKTETVARKIIGIAKTGKDDPKRIAALVVSGLAGSEPS